MKKIFHLLSFILFSPVLLANDRNPAVADICIYGGTSAGVIAAYTAAKAGKKVLLIEPGGRLGGLTSGGLGMTDIGNKYVVTGLALDFYRKLGKHYGNFENRVFEPGAALSVFNHYIKSANIQVIYNRQLVTVKKDNQRISMIAFANLEKNGADKLTVEAKVYMDCTYEGDLMAMAGVSYTVGREDNSLYQETLNGVQLMKGHQLPDGIDPYKIKGNPASGLIWGVHNEALQANGTGDRKVQAYNYRITLTDDPANKMAITRPPNYDPQKYELLIRQKQIQPWKELKDVFSWNIMPNRKTDINNRNGMSTDMIGANWAYPEASWQQRQEIIKDHEAYTKGLLYFVGNDPAVPDFIRSEMQRWGYPKDEYLENNHWSPQLYIREARRMIGDMVMTQHHCQGREVVTDGVGYAAYTMDSHNCDRLVVNGMVKNEGNVEVGGFPPFPISYRAIVPRKAEIQNLLVPVCLSASHIAFGSIRMEPVFMVLGQSAAVAASIAIDKNIPVQEVPAGEIKEILTANPKADYRKPDLLVQVADSSKVSIQGQWTKVPLKGYGRYHLETSSPKGSLRFNFDSNAGSGAYKAYYYLPKMKEAPRSVTLEVWDGSRATQKDIDLTGVKIAGQTGSAWVEIGTFNYDFSKNVYIKVVKAAGAGTVAANAVLLVPDASVK